MGDPENRQEGIRANLLSAKVGLYLRLCALVGLAILLVSLFGFIGGGQPTVVLAYHNQGIPGYDSPTDPPPAGTTPGYDSPETDTPPTGATATEASATAAVSSTPTIELTATETATMGPNVFGTEDAEINEALTTPQFTEAAAPSITPYFTPTITATKTPLPARTPAAAKKNNGFTPDWGMFWIGFSLPVLGACGVVLYLLDRRPDLFRRR